MIRQHIHALRQECRDSRLEKSIEVASLIYHHGMSEAEAAAVVGIGADDLVHIDRLTKNLHWLPSPSCIEAAKREILSGEVQFAALSSVREKERSCLLHNREADAADEFETAGSLPEDQSAMPSWFRG